MESLIYRWKIKTRTFSSTATSFDLLSTKQTSTAFKCDIKQNIPWNTTSISNCAQLSQNSHLYTAHPYFLNIASTSESLGLHNLYQRTHLKCRFPVGSKAVHCFAMGCSPEGILEQLQNDFFQLLTDCREDNTAQQLRAASYCLQQWFLLQLNASTTK